MLDTLGVQRVAVIAVSGGGPSAVYFAARHPGRCWGLVLVSTVATVTPNRLPWSFSLMGVAARVPWVAAGLARKASQDPEGGARRSITDPVLFDRTRRDPESWALLMELQASTMDRMAARVPGTKNDVAVCRTREFPFEQITTPALVVHGTRDPLVPIAQHGEVSARRIAGAELVALEGGEHAAIFSHRDEARSRVAAFLRSAFGDPGSKRARERLAVCTTEQTPRHEARNTGNRAQQPRTTP
jgi:pimeloyl-ACP methyl ester carboxylesterase